MPRILLSILLLSALPSSAGAQAPTAEFSGAPRIGGAPLTVYFQDFSTGSVTAWSWDFGDGGTSLERNPVYVYRTAGIYTVALTVGGTLGLDSTTKVGYVVVEEPAPTADFVGSPTSGLPPLIVNFTGQTSGIVTSGSWDFGDGGTSTATNPGYTYMQPGTYTVSLTVVGPGGAGSVIKPGYVTVLEHPPVAAFDAAPKTGAGPLTVQFTDLSGGEVTSYDWDFGDGEGSSSRNPLHLYDTPGTYTVALTATGPGGSDALSKPGEIVVTEPAPVADFSATPLDGEAPLIVAFENLTTNAATGGFWDFGDGTTSNDPMPTHLYSSAGAYTVSLTATGPGGSDTETKFEYVTVRAPAPVADFSGTPTSGVAPYAVVFSNTTSGMVTSWAWSFGDGAFSNARDPVHSYTESGVFTVALTATGPGGVDSITRTNYVTVFEPVPFAEFWATPRSGSAPLSVAFQDFSSGAVTNWLWSFGDGSFSSEQHPTHVYAAPGSYTVSLMVGSNGGSDSTMKPDYVKVGEPTPVADFSAAPLSGAAPLTVLFTDLSSGGVITSVAWDFGDGAVSSATNPSHVYAGPGSYTVALTAAGPAGEDTKVEVDLIEVLEPPPVADFAAAPVTGTAPLSVQFTDLSSGAIDTWGWDFGDGASSIVQSPSHSFDTPGTYTVALTVGGPGGSDTEAKSALVTVEPAPPIAAFSGTPRSGPAPLTVSFVDLSTGADTLAWDFGDGQGSTLPTPTHTYAAPGAYTVSLSASGPGGVDEAVEFDYIAVAESPPVPDFNGTPRSGVAPHFVSFSDRTSGMVSGVSWSFGDGTTSTLKNPGHTYTSSGSFTVSLTAIGPGGVATETKAGFVVVAEPPPVVAFSGVPLAGNAPLSVSFTDFSSGDISGWSWSFGDGGTSSEQHPTHVYATAGAYDVGLAVLSAGGSDSVVKTGYVVVGEEPPIANFFSDRTGGLAPVTVQFFADLSGGSVTMGTWDFGDNTTFTGGAPQHTYSAVGFYTVTLTVSGPGGTDSETKVDYVKVVDMPPVADFSGTPLSGPAPLEVAFTDLSAGVVEGWLWTFGDGATSVEQNPVHTYAASGRYTVRLRIAGPGGNDDERKLDYVVVAEPAPTAAFSAAPTAGSLPLVVSFTDLSQGNVTSWSWDFGDGSGSTLQNPSHSYGTQGVYTVSLTATGPSGSDTETKIDHVFAGQVPLIADGSFEQQTAGLPPTSPWTITSGTAHVVQPVAIAQDGRMPVFGAQWVELAADGTVAATPPSNPGGTGAPPSGAAGISQSFTCPSATPWIVFSAAFVLAGPASSSSFNDFMSVDVTDGVTTANLYHADSFSSFPLVSQVHGLPMTTVVTPAANLFTLFPGATANTVFTLTIEVGNGGDGAAPSKGYFDGLRYGPLAAASSRNGSGANVPCYTNLTPPTLGTLWRGEVSHAHHPSASFTLLEIRSRPSPGIPTKFGELLVAGAQYLQHLVASSGTKDAHDFPLPVEGSLAGLPASVQAAILGGTGPELCNALDVVLGF